MTESTKNRLLSPLILYLIPEKLSIGVRIFSKRWYACRNRWQGAEFAPLCRCATSPPVPGGDRNLSALRQSPPPPCRPHEVGEMSRSDRGGGEGDAQRRMRASFRRANENFTHTKSGAKEATPIRNEISASALDFVILRLRQGLFQVFNVAFLREIVAGLLGHDARKRNQGNDIRQGH